MTSQSFSRPGAVDLSALANAANQSNAAAGAAGGLPSGGVSSSGLSSGAAPGAGGAAPGAYVVAVTEQTFDPVVRMSLQYPVVLELTSPVASGGAQLSRDLEELSDAAQGQWVLGRVDIDAEPRIAQALGVQAVPTVVAVIGGQLAPLFQGTKPKAEVAMYLDEVLRLAAANGIVGRAEPAAGGVPTDDGEGGGAEPPADPRFADADQAMAEGRFDDAVAEFDKVIAQAPGDQEAIAGRAQAALLARSMKTDPALVVADASARPDDIDAQLDAADLEVIQGQAEAAFERLLDVIRGTTADDRDRVRVRLLELFETVGRTDPAVLKARRQLSTALF